MTREEASKILYHEWQVFLEKYVDYSGVSEAYKIAIKALEQYPCEDCISRKYLLSIANKDGAYGYVSAHDIANAPSVNPQEPKTGHWKRVSMDKYTEAAKYWHICDKCGEKNLGNTNYCPNCGAKMLEMPTGSESEG